MLRMYCGHRSCAVELKYSCSVNVSVLAMLLAYPVPLIVSGLAMTGLATTVRGSKLLVSVLARAGFCKLKASTYSSPATIIVLTCTTSLPAARSHSASGSKTDVKMPRLSASIEIFAFSVSKFLRPSMVMLWAQFCVIKGTLLRKLTVMMLLSSHGNGLL